MKNIEKYYDELNSSCLNPNCYWVKKMENDECTGMSCYECGRNFLQWLNEECKEPIKLTKVQYEILKCLGKECSVVMINGKLIVHKDNLEHFLSRLAVQVTELDWDEKQVKIKDILENCEVIE